MLSLHPHVFRSRRKYINLTKIDMHKLEIFKFLTEEEEKLLNYANMRLLHIVNLSKLHQL